MSVKGEALSTDAGPASAGAPSAGPRVVIGSVPPSDPPPSAEIETPDVVEAKGPATTRSSASALLTSSIIKSEPPPAPAPEPAPNFAKTLAFGSKINELPQSERVEVVANDRQATRDRLKEQREKAQEAQKAISPKEDPDEISVPPANDMNVEDEKFFDDADVAVRKSVHEFEMMARQEAEDAVPENQRRKLDPQVIRRRQRFVGYVKIAVAGAAVVCLAALGSSAVSRSRAPAQAAQAQPQAVQPIAVTPETPPPAAAEPVAPKAAEPAAAPVESAAPAASEAPKEEITGDAKEELKKSRTALEKRQLPEAIEAGERAVALDATDAEAWLILGAAYQEKGDLKNAHRCYASCFKEAKTGPRLECQKMLR